MTSPQKPELEFASESISLSKVLSALSFALDLTSGQTMGHAQRSCLIALRIAKIYGVSEDMQSSLYHAMLLKDSGCSSNAARLAEIFGNDDISAKRLSKITDWSDVFEAAGYVASQTLPGKSLLARVQRILYISTHKKEASDEILNSRCSRGAEIALMIGLGPDAADCIRNLDEHWDGKGGPGHLRGDAIPVLGRIACIAQTLEVFAKTFDVETAYEVISKRKNKWFDPELVRIAKTFEHDEEFWSCGKHSAQDELQRIELNAVVEKATNSRIDGICEAFAQIVDAKSHFTAEHSSRVTKYSVLIGKAFGLKDARLTTLKRAALLHDLGKLSLSNTILDNPGKPSKEDWIAIRKHPFYTQEILSHIEEFARVKEIAAAHHERLDGSGYFMGLTRNELDLEMRILSCADVFDALSARRPYREAMPLDQVFGILDNDANVGLDGKCIEVLKSAYAGNSGNFLEESPVPIRLAA